MAKYIDEIDDQIVYEVVIHREIVQEFRVGIADVADEAEAGNKALGLEKVNREPGWHAISSGTPEVAEVTKTIRKIKRRVRV